MGRSPISSRNSVPLPAASIRPCLVCMRAGESALHVAEQLRFNQRGNKRGAIYRSEWPVAARPGKMDGARHQFFAGAALSQNQYWIIVLAHFFNQLVHALHLGRQANQASKPRTRSKLLPQHAIFLVEFERAHHAVELGSQLRYVERLGDVIGGARFASLLRHSRSCRIASARSPAFAGCVSRTRFNSSSPPISGTRRSVIMMSTGYCSRISSACSVVDAVRVRKPDSTTMSRQSSRVVFSSSTIRTVAAIARSAEITVSIPLAIGLTPFPLIFPFRI